MARQQTNPRLFTIAIQQLQIGLDEMRRFIDIGEHALESEFKDWGDWYEKQTQGFSEEEKHEFVDAYYDDLATVRDLAPQLFRRACFVMQVDFWETTAANLVRTLHRFGLLSGTPKQRIYHGGSKDYLLNHVGFRKSAFGRAWAFCERADKVRNIIVHNNGELPHTPQTQNNLAKDVKIAKRFIKSTAHIHLSDSSSVELEQGFCYAVNEKAVECVETLIAEAHRIHDARGKKP
ncbi:MAG: hypothetical protein NTZ17_07970 [Phycisphaerae bacterium]|nr:hypothetical protein [Phycisphaerae bacterium]